MTQGMAHRILELAQELGALQFGEFTLSSGLSSSYYFDGRLLTRSVSRTGSNEEVVVLTQRRD